MTHDWIKFVFERDTYVVDLNRISSFVCAENGRLMFWLPDGKIQIIIHPQNNPEAYQQILDYVEKMAGQALPCARKDGGVKPAKER